MSFVKSIKKTKFFTLIELIVVIVILGILTAIVIPNISSQKDEATRVSIQGNARNLQNAVDTFSVKNHGTHPTVNKATIGKPEPLDMSQLNPEFLRNLPKTKGMKYWVDYTGTLWLSMADAPTNVNYSNGELTWNPSSDSEGYNVFAAEKNDTTSSVRRKNITLIKEVKGSKANTMANLPVLEENQSYYISAVDKYGLETPPVSGEYTGYQNQKPVVNLSFLNEGALLDNVPLELNAGSFIDPDNDEIVEVQWKINNQEILSELPNEPLPVGEHVVEVRIKDEQGLWSEWDSTTVTVLPSNRIPNAVITMNPTVAYANTNIVWSYSNSTDPDGDQIVAAEWKVNGILKSNPNGMLQVGSHLIELRVKDSAGSWSEWVSKSFSIDNRIPIAKITNNHSSTITSLTNLSWYYNTSTDPDGDSIVAKEWKLDGVLKSNPNGTLPEGVRKLELRVKDSKGAWSDWVSYQFVVSKPTFDMHYNQPYSIFSYIRSNYGYAYGPTLRAFGDNMKSGAVVEIQVAGYGTSLQMTHSRSFETRIDQQTINTIRLTLQPGGSYPIHFNYTDSWVQIHSIKVISQ